MALSEELKQSELYREIAAEMAKGFGEQKAEFAIDGVHMNANGYRVVFENLKPHLPL